MNLAETLPECVNLEELRLIFQRRIQFELAHSLPKLRSFNINVPTTKFKRVLEKLNVSGYNSNFDQTIFVQCIWETGY